MGVCTWVVGVQWPEALDFLGTNITSGCEPSKVGAGNQIWFLCKSTLCFLTAEISFQPRVTSLFKPDLSVLGSLLTAHLSLLAPYLYPCGITLDGKQDVLSQFLVFSFTLCVSSNCCRNFPLTIASPQGQSPHPSSRYVTFPSLLPQHHRH